MSVVTNEFLERFAREYYANSPRCPYTPEIARTAPMDIAYLRTTEDGAAMRAALAAVAPLIAKAERERCAELADVGNSMAQSPGAKRTASSIAAAIRALGDADG